MRLEMQKRGAPSQVMSLMSPVLAIILTLITGAIMFGLLGFNPGKALYVYFVEPLLDPWSLQELVVKASPLILIAVGLTICYRSNNWNIGAEGQFTMGAIFGSVLPIMFPDFQNYAVFPIMLAMGAIGGGLFAYIPALLKNRFATNEILTSLMLTYVALLFLDFLVRGPWKDPDGYNFPESRLFNDYALTPSLFEGGRMHIGAVFAVVAAILVFVLFIRTLKGFEIKVIGETPRAGNFAGFSKEKMTVFAFVVSGALTGLAGILEVAGPIGQLRPTISPGYGFTAIIVAFLGRLNPIGAIFAGLLLALSYLGGEAAQVDLGISEKTAKAFQGILLFYVLACDTLIHYRIRIVWRNKLRAKEVA
ncbi:simple sugar transport system permease protein [Cohaesibacter marisflavi]|uniref:Simple sugar transport system permease protein n=1 Tax=Cohaesibacter marisflavi TaxID=655353 RepID=A0A1I5I700_9HYPH|nr:ABC transporter permease [Cohaesibacter marisflavi]SFO56353.1 simple sugar transport system permease protein [Cohaesibacter marisflavi]